MADDSAALCSPAPRPPVVAHHHHCHGPSSLFQDAERPDKCSQLSIYNTAGFIARTNTPLPTIAIMHAITAELHTEQGRDTCLVGTLGH